MGVGYMNENVVKTARDGEMVISDGSGTPNTITVAFDRGDFSFEKKRNVTVIKDRGAFSHLREGEEEVVVCSFSGHYTGLHAASGDDESPYEALWNANSAGWTSTTDATSDVYTVDLIMTYTEIDGATEIITIDNFAITSFKFDEAMDGNTYSVTGLCAATDLTITGAAAP